MLGGAVAKTFSRGVRNHGLPVNEYFLPIFGCFPPLVQ